MLSVFTPKQLHGRVRNPTAEKSYVIVQFHCNFAIRKTATRRKDDRFHLVDRAFQCNEMNWDGNRMKKEERNAMWKVQACDHRSTLLESARRLSVSHPAPTWARFSTQLNTSTYPSSHNDTRRFPNSLRRSRCI